MIYAVILFAATYVLMLALPKYRTYVALASDRPVPELLKIYQGTMALLAKEFSGYTLICSHNEPVRGGEMLGKTADALAEILAGKEPDEIGSAGLRRYEFDGFAVITR